MKAFNYKLLILFLVFNTVYAEEKMYTESEFEEKLEEELLRKVDALKKKSISDLTKELLAKRN